MTPAAILKAALRLPTTPREAEATAAVAKLVSGLRLAVWGNGYQSLRSKRLSQYDLGWGRTGATDPSVILQMKSGGIHQEDQSVLELLNDVVYAAYDKSRAGGANSAYFCATVLHPGKKNRKYWPNLAAITGRCILSSTPSAARDQHGAAAATWIDLKSRALTPYTRTQFGQIFSGTQKAKYVGLFNRPGTLTIEFKAQIIQAGASPHRFDVLFWQIIDAQLNGTALSLRQWLP